MSNHEAIYNTHSNVISIDDGLGGAWDANGDVVVLDESAIATEVNRLQAAYDALDYSRVRKAKYDLLNQFEMRFDDQVNSTTTWVDAINAIKAAHPKP